jgi:hypothetical protein
VEGNGLSWWSIEGELLLDQKSLRLEENREALQRFHDKETMRPSDCRRKRDSTSSFSRFALVNWIDLLQRCRSRIGDVP